MGIVVGSRPDPYVQVVQLKPENRFENWCSCPMEEGCKHVAAILYHYVDHPRRAARAAESRLLPGDRSIAGSRSSTALVATAANEPPDEPVPGKPVLLYQLDGSAPRETDGDVPGGGHAATGRGTASMRPGSAWGVRRSRLLVRGGFRQGERCRGSSTRAWLAGLVHVDRPGHPARPSTTPTTRLYRAARTVGEPGTLFVGRAGGAVAGMPGPLRALFSRQRPFRVRSGDGWPARAHASLDTGGASRTGPDARLALRGDARGRRGVGT